MQEEKRLDRQRYPEALRSVYARIAKCKECVVDAVTGPKLRQLPGADLTGQRAEGGERERFQFDWWPYLGVDGQRIRYLFVAMEPSCAEGAPPSPYPGLFNRPLLFAIEKYLCNEKEQDGYLITNLAKCSIPVRCAKTTEKRYELCAPWLKEELKAIDAEGVRFFFSIGKKPLERARDLLRRHLQNSELQVHYLMHYSNVARRWRKAKAVSYSEMYPKICQEVRARFAEQYTKLFPTEAGKEQLESQLEAVLYYRMRFFEVAGR